MRLFAFLTEHFERALTLLFVAGFALFLISAFTGAGGELIGGDASSYFEYARSLLAEGRLPREHIKYPCGVALIGLLGYGPTMLAAKLAAAAAGASLPPRWATGWALPAQVAYCLPLMAFAWIGFRANVSMFIRLGFSDRVVKPMTLFWVTTTNIGFYVLKEPAMSEGATYAALSLFYWALIRWFYEPPRERSLPVPIPPISMLLWRAMVVGAFLGLAGMIRQQNILHCFAVPLLLMSPGGRRLAFRQRSLMVATTALASLPLFALPWLIWYAGEGTFTLYSYGKEGFNFLAPHLLLILFHPGYHGLFVFHPAYAVAAAGLISFIRRHRDLGVVWLSSIATQSYLMASWWFLSFGASVGHRGFFPVAPLLLAGWMSIGEWATQRSRLDRLAAVMILLTIGNAIITLLVVTHRIPALGIQPG